MAAAPLNATGVVDAGVELAGTDALPEAPATPATPGTGVAAGGDAVTPAWFAAGVPAARPTLVPEVAKCIGDTTSWVESSEVVVQPGAMAPVAWTWTWPSVIWLTRPLAIGQATVTVAENGIVVNGTLPDGAGVGAGLPGIGAVVVVVWPAWTGTAGAGVTGPAGGATTAGLLPAGGATAAGLLPAGVETGVGMSCTDLVTMTGCWGTYCAQSP